MAITRHLFVISDLHLGGHWPKHTNDPGFRMMTRPDVLAAFIHNLAGEHARAPDSPVHELVINGDFLDFLAEEHPEEPRWRPFLAGNAQARGGFSTMAGRQGDEQVFCALAKLLDHRHHLTLLLGNHDLELSLPSVRQALAQRLGAGPGTPLRFVLDNEAYRVGNTLIEHGNRYDAWNQVDHDGLRRLRSLHSRGQYAEAQREDPFQVQAGSLLVAEAMNPLKADYAFVDLLKPEGRALYALLVTLHPALLSQAPQLATYLWGLRRHGMQRAALPKYAGNISAGGDDTQTPAPDGSELLASLFTPAELDLLRQESDPAPHGDIGARSRLKGLWRRLSDARLSLIRKAMGKLNPNAVFSPDEESDKQTREATEALTCHAHEPWGVDTVVFGHTHLAKDVPLKSDGRYLNCGTWANLMRFPVGIFQPDAHRGNQALRDFLADMEENRLADHLRFEPHCVHLVVEDQERVTAATLGAIDPQNPAVPV